MLTPERWEEVERLFHGALERAPAERASFVAAACGADAELAREVTTLLAAESDDDHSPPAIAAAAADWAATARAEPAAGQTIDGYRILSPIGEGGMGEVYLAEELALGRRVALKLLPEAFSRDAGRLRRFAEEARAASALNHPNIVTVFHVGEVEGRRYIVTEFVDGETLRQRLARGPVPLDEALDIAVQAAGALAAAHEAGIVHRDIKPDNLMIRRDGYLKIVDFGIAKLEHDGAGASHVGGTAAGAVVGTPDYMAPEQASGGAVDARADLYSLAVVLHEIVTGVLPRELSSAGSDTAWRGRRLPPAPVRRVLRRALATEPSARYQTALEMQRELERARRGITRAWSRAGLVAAACVAVALVVAGVMRWRRPAAPSGTVASLIVMPFKALGGVDQAHLEAGMSDAIVTRLGGVLELRVPPPAAIQANEDPFAAARRLGVDAVLTGSVQRDGAQLRVTAQLSRAADRSQIWAAHFDEKFTDIFGIQDEIAERIAANLVARLSPGDRAALARHETENPQAYDMYLRARDQWALRSRESIATSIKMYQQAIAIEPDFALAYAGLADAYNLTASGLASEVRLPLAKAAAEKAIALDPQSAEAHTALAFCEYKLEWKWAESEREFQRAIALNPDYALARHWYGEFLKLLGRHDESIQQFERAVALDPFSIPVRYDFILALLEAHQTARARALLDESFRLDVSSTKLMSASAAVLAAEGHEAESVETGLRSELLQGRSEREVDALRAAYRTGGARSYDRMRIAFLLGELPRRASERPMPELTSDLAGAYAAVGDRERALHWLTRAVELHEDGPLLMKTREFDVLRGDPRLDALERRIGMTP